MFPVNLHPANDQRVMDQSKVSSSAVKRLVDTGYSIFGCQIFFSFQLHIITPKASRPKNKGLPLTDNQDSTYKQTERPYNEVHVTNLYFYLKYFVFLFFLYFFHEGFLESW